MKIYVRAWSWEKITVAILVMLALGSVSVRGFAEVKPGDMITMQSAARVRDLVSPGVYYKVEHGMSMKIVPTQRVDWTPPYKDATEKYSSQVRLTPDHRSVLGYVAGQPFPLIDANDADVGVKVIWNNVFRPITSDDYDLRFYDCDSHYVTPGQPQSGQIEYFQIGHYAGYDLVGRTEVEPMPTHPDFNTTNPLWLFGLFPILAPQEDRGLGFIRYRYADPKRGDDSWEWLPGARRIRRLNESIMSSRTGAQAWDPDHYSGFNPKTDWYNYKLVGEKNMLATAHAEHSPEVRCATDGGTSACPEAWEMRHIYIVEASPRDGFGKSGNVLDGKTLIFMDSELWFGPYIDTYDRQGHLWTNHIYWLADLEPPVPLR